MSLLHSPVLGDLPATINIGGRKVGPGHPCYVIAEAGSNHDGRLEKALALVDAAADAGCDAVKFQTFTAEEIAADVPMPRQFRKWGRSLQDLYRACAMPDRFHEPILRRAKERGIHFFSSPFSERAVDRLAKLGVPALKIASFELVHLPLIRHAARTGIPLILSTGMAGLGDVERALDAAAGAGAKAVSLMHCGSSYPLTPKGAHLRAMETMRLAFGVPIGYSDHTLGIGVPVAAAAIGADLVEKHFTLSRSGKGPDHGFAVETSELKQMVAAMRDAQAALGLPRKRQQPEEEAYARTYRRSVFAARDIPAGEPLTPDHVKVVRPGSGIEPLTLELLWGRRLARAVPAGEPLRWDDIIPPAGARRNGKAKRAARH